ncbi:heme ABC transporter ATP-binding protein [Actinacidiphila epipremni]|uniref:Heme ABC transporter ATP-binding protein n=1 Tax=Actinacidiphila epipremni TaxID=2053013 RepID=A0ABX0ZSU6_9ACTN|nr:heme ABC transporter ATP-binding protein [Actinacidiphila epipremni]NJP44698.1 heme ABC transporter ATP-binding protein [Actinacidiphila epipremni]
MSLLPAALRRDRTAPPPPPRPGEVLARARELTVRLGPRPVLHDVDLDVTAGHVLALVGPNGAGKSTLLGALAGDVPAESGGIALAGAPLTTWTPRQLAMRRAVLPQSAPLAFPFTAGDVVRMGRAPWAGTPLADEDDAAVAEAMAVTETTGFADRPYPALSGGERARVALARVLAQRAALLLLDEPTAALDLHHQELVLRVCREQAAAGKAIVIVLHDLGLAAAHADRVAVLAAGRRTAYGAPADVLTADLLSEVYRHPVEVLPHPRTGHPLIHPLRDPTP